MCYSEISPIKFNNSYTHARIHWIRISNAIRCHYILFWTGISFQVNTQLITFCNPNIFLNLLWFVSLSVKGYYASFWKHYFSKEQSTVDRCFLFILATPEGCYAGILTKRKGFYFGQERTIVNYFHVSKPGTLSTEFLLSLRKHAKLG